MKLVSRIKTEHGRCVPPEETVARLEAILAPRFDYWLHQESLSDHLHWTAMFIDDQSGFRAMGKGVNAAFSHAGALAEGAEWLAASNTERLPGYICGHQRDIPDALPIEDLVSHVASVTPPVMERILNLPETRHWVDGWSLCHEKKVKVPIEYVRLLNGPNGKASGNFLEEAIVHAIAETFERRSHVTVLRNRMIVPTFALGSIEHPVVREQIDFIRGKGIEVILKDLSFGGDLPCVGAYFFDPGIPREYQFHHFFKVGAAFDRDEALMRCFTEFTQGRRKQDFADAGSDAGAPLEELLEADFRRLPTQRDDCDNFLSAFMFGMVPYRDASFLREGEVKSFEPGARHADCLDDIASAREVCLLLGKDFIVVDLTDPEIGFPVVQVVVPGYSDVLPFHPASSTGLFKRWTRNDVLAAFHDGNLNTSTMSA